MLGLALIHHFIMALLSKQINDILAFRVL
jgi:hypothetical protein